MISKADDLKTELIKFVSPLRQKWECLKLIIPFLKTIFSKERLLPEKRLSDYLERNLNKKDVLLESAEKFGTPQYFYDQPDLLDSIRRFHEAFSRNLQKYRGFYALKSNCFHLIIKDVVKMGMGLDASSGRELRMALDTDSKKILFSGPGKTDEELLFALENSKRTILLIDNFNELYRLGELVKKTKQESSVDIGVRISSSLSGEWSKFGIPMQDLSEFAEKANRMGGIILRGIQTHSSWNMNPSRHVSMLMGVSDYLLKYLPGDILRNLEFIDIGGGFWPENGEWLNPENLSIARMADALGVNISLKNNHYYRPSLPIDEFAQDICKCFLSRPKPVCDLELFMEPGRWISNPAMHILLRVVDKKGSNAVITDGGINLLGWERPLTEFIPVINLTRFQMKERAIKIYGSLCAPEDIWGNSIFGGEALPGDVLLLPDQGAYTYSFRQAFIKPVARVIKYNGCSLEQVEKQTE